jgi:hypothetical protein
MSSIHLAWLPFTFRNGLDRLGCFTPQVSTHSATLACRSGYGGNCRGYDTSPLCLCQTVPHVSDVIRKLTNGEKNIWRPGPDRIRRQRAKTKKSGSDFRKRKSGLVCNVSGSRGPTPRCYRYPSNRSDQIYTSYTLFRRSPSQKKPGCGVAFSYFCLGRVGDSSEAERRR